MTIPKQTEWILLDCLRNLSDLDQQRRLWLGKIPNVVASFSEDHMGLPHDSGLKDALKSGGAGYGPKVDGILALLIEALASVDAAMPDEVIIECAEMVKVRELAAQALERIRDRAPPLSM